MHESVGDLGRVAGFFAELVFHFTQPFAGLFLIIFSFCVHMFQSRSMLLINSNVSSLHISARVQRGPTFYTWQARDSARVLKKDRAALAPAATQHFRPS